MKCKIGSLATEERRLVKTLQFSKHWNWHYFDINKLLSFGFFEKNSEAKDVEKDMFFKCTQNVVNSEIELC